MTRTHALVQIAAAGLRTGRTPVEAAEGAHLALAQLEAEAERRDCPLQFDPTRAEELAQLPDVLLDVLARLGLVHEVSMGESDAPH